MSAPVDNAFNILLNDTGFQQKQTDRRSEIARQKLRHGIIHQEGVKHSNAPPIERLDKLLNTRRAESIVARMDVGVQAGPDAVKQRIRTFEETDDATGQKVPGINPRRRADLLGTIKNDETLIDFFEQNPEAIMLGADDDSFTGPAYEALKWFATPTERFEAGVEGFESAGAMEEVGDAAFALLEARTSGFGAENMAELEARLAAAEQRLEASGVPVDLDDPDTYIAGLSQMTRQIGEDAIEGAKFSATLAPFFFAGGAAVGSPSGPGALASGAAATAVTAPFTFAVGLTKSVYKREAGLFYSDLIRQGYAADGFDTKFATHVYASVSSLVEVGALALGVHLVGKPLVGATKRHLANLARGSIRESLKRGSRRQALQRIGLNVTGSAGAEGIEELIQGSFAQALGEVAAEEGTDLIANMDDVVAKTIDNLDQAAREGVVAFGSALLGGGLLKAASFRSISQAHQEAAREQEFFDAYSDFAEQSTLVERSPELAGEFVGLITEGTDRDNVFIDRELFESALNQEGIAAPDIEQALPGISGRIEESKETGRRLAIPSRDFASTIAGSKIMPLIRDGIAASETGLTNAERKEMFQRQREAQSASEVVREHSEVLADEIALDESAERVGTRISDQLTATGARSPKVAKQEAEAVTARVRAFAAQLSNAGERVVTPEEAFAIYPLNVVGSELRGETLGQSEIVSAVALVTDLETGQPRVFRGANHGEAAQNAVDAGFSFDQIEDDYFLTGDGRVISRFEGSQEFDITSSETAGESGQPITESASGEITVQEILAMRENLLGQSEIDAAIQIFEQSEVGRDTSRAQIALKEREAFVRLTETSDLSSFQHELSHWYLQQMVVADQLGLASDQMRADLQTIVEWTGAESVDKLTRPLGDREFRGNPDIPHEIFARGFETYLAESRAPSPELEPVFARFRRWISQAYGGIRAAFDALGTPLNEEVRAVYDRLFLIDVELDRADGGFSGPTFETPDSMGLELTDPEWRKYQRAWEKAKDVAWKRLAKKHVGSIRKQRRAEREALRKEIKVEAQAALREDPAWQAIRWIKRGEAPFGNDDLFVDTNIGLDRSLVQDIFGAEGPRIVEILNSRPGLGGGRKLVAGVGRGGLDPDEIAEIFGFRSGRQLIDGMISARTAEQTAQERINREISNAPIFSDEQIQADALEAVANDPREEVLAAELRALRELAGGESLARARRRTADTGAPSRSDTDNRLTTARAELDAAVASGDEQAIADSTAAVQEAQQAAQAEREGRRAQRAAARSVAEIEERLRTRSLKRRAQQLVGGREVRTLKQDRRAWQAQTVKEGRAARKLVAQRNYASAAQSIERQLLAHYAMAESSNLINETERGQKYLSEIRRGKKLDKLYAPGFDGGAQILALLNRYGLTKTKPSQGETTKLARKLRRAHDNATRDQELVSLQEFVSAAENQAQVVDIPPFVVRDSTTRHWSELSAEEFLGLVDLVRNIETVSRQEVRDITTGKNIQLGDAARSISERLRAVNQLVKRGSVVTPMPRHLDWWRKNLRAADSALIKPEDLIDFMGGDDVTGNALRKHVWQPIEEARKRYLEMFREHSKGFAKVIEGLDWRRMNQMHVIQELGDRNTLAHYEIFMMGLNWGNTSNRTKLIDGYANAPEYGWTEAGIQAALRKLNDAEWSVIQGVWDSLESLRPAIAKNHFQATGRKLGQIEAEAFVAPTGREMRGGYFPAVYDPDKDKTGRVQKLVDKADADGLFGFSHTKAETEQGHTKGRSEGFSAPMNLNPMVIPQHLTRVVHDIAFRQPISDVYRLLNHPEVKSAIVDTWGNEYNAALDNWIKKTSGQKTVRVEKVNRIAGRVSEGLRSSIVTMGLGYRAATGLLQLTGVFPIFSEVGPVYTLRAIAWFARDPLGNMARIREESALVRDRGAGSREVREASEALIGQKGPHVALRRHQMAFIIAGDSVVSTIAYQAQLYKSLEDHGDLDRARIEADRAVKRTQGGGQTEDLSSLMNTDTPFARWITLFGSFASNLYARQRRIYRVGAGLQAQRDSNGRPITKRDLPKALGLWAATVFVPAVIEALMRGQGPDEEALEEDLLMWGAANTASFIAMPVPLLNEIIDPILHPDRPVFSSSPAARMFEPATNTLTMTWGAYQGEEDLDQEKLLRESIKAVGYFGKLPTAQAEIWVDNFYEDQRLESWRDVIWRKPRERR